MGDFYIHCFIRVSILSNKFRLGQQRTTSMSKGYSVKEEVSQSG